MDGAGFLPTIAEAIPIPPGPFDFVMADPPWHLKTNSAAKPGRNALGKYRVMTLPDIMAMRDPILASCAPDCLLWLWATAPMLPQQLAVVQAWGFRFSTVGVWTKRTRHGKLAFGTGFRLRNSHEMFIIATRGKPRTTRGVRSVVEGLLREHSQKPEEAYAAAEKLMPDARRLDLFSRTDRPGWTAWGDQAGTIPLVEAA